MDSGLDPGQVRRADFPPAILRLGLGVASGAGLAFAVFLLTAPDVGPPPVNVKFADKYGHFLAFFCLTAPAAALLPRSLSLFWGAHMVVFGAGVEVVQAIQGHNRSADPWDAAFNALGVVAALWVTSRIRERLRLR